LIIPERLRTRHWDGFHKTMLTGKPSTAPTCCGVPAVDKGGRALSIAFTVALLHSADGKPAAIAAVIRDETTRFMKSAACASAWPSSKRSWRSAAPRHERTGASSYWLRERPPDHPFARRLSPIK